MSDIEILYLDQVLNEYTIRAVENRVLNLLSQGKSQIILEAEAVDHVEWPAVGKILGLKRVLRQFEGDLKVAGLPSNVKGPFNRFGANQVLEMYPSLPEAVRSFTNYPDDTRC